MSFRSIQQKFNKEDFDPKGKKKKKRTLIPLLCPHWRTRPNVCRNHSSSCCMSTGFMDGCYQLNKDIVLDQDLLEQERTTHHKKEHFEASVGQGSCSSYSFGDLYDSSIALQLKRDEALAWALQDADDQEQFMRMLRESDEIPVMQIIDRQALGSDSTNMNDIDPDSMSYEERVALGEALGSQIVGLSPEEIGMLEEIKFKKCSLKDKDVQCVICQQLFEKQSFVIVLPCKHLYHADCVRQWLKIKKVCPVCNVEVVISK